MGSTGRQGSERGNASRLLSIVRLRMACEGGSMSEMDKVDQAQQLEIDRLAEHADKNKSTDNTQWAVLVAVVVAVLYLSAVFFSASHSGSNPKPQRVILEIVPGDLKELCALAR